LHESWGSDMSRIRTIKPEFWRDEELSTVSPEAALLAIGLLNHADDEGYFNANPKLIEADVFPLRDLSRSTTVLITELAEIGYLELFKGSDGKQYGHIRNFSKHQVINKKNVSKIKGLHHSGEDSRSPTVALPVGMEWNGKEKEGSAEGASPPVVLPFEKPEKQKPEFTEGFVRFWDVWPSTDRKEAKGKCFDVWKKAKAESQAGEIIAHVERLKSSQAWTKSNGDFIPAPLVYLNQRRWEGADTSAAEPSSLLAGCI
jgi:hypothetical protein